MKEEGPRTGRMLLAAAVFMVVVGSAWYITYLRTQNTQLRSQQPQPQAAAPQAAAPAADANPPAAGDRTLSGAQRDAMLAKLRATAGSERPVWFATYANHTEAASFRLALQTLFEEAGWEVRGNAQVNFQLKPGLHLMAAEEEPPQYVLDVGDALEAGGLAVTIGRGYRAFFEEKKKDNPSWNGISLAPDQSYVLVVGPKPPS